MDLPLSRVATNSSRHNRRRNWFVILAAAGLTGYGAYKLYNLPAVAAKRRKLVKLLRALVSVAEAVSSSADTVSLVSTDIRQFLQSDSDEIPASIKQLSKIASSDEFTASVSRVSEAVTVGMMRGFQTGPDGTGFSKPGISDKVIDRLFSTAGSGFVSVVAGNFARGLVEGYYSGRTSGVVSDSASSPDWVNVMCSDKCRPLIGDCIQEFVGSAVAVYLEKTAGINSYNEMFSGLTHPKHEEKVKDLLVSVCNGAVETLVETSHRVLTSSRASSSTGGERVNGEEVELPLKQVRRTSFDDKPEDDDGGWFGKVTSTLSVPSNRKFVLDLTGRVTFDTVRSLLEFLLWKLSDSVRRGVDVVRKEILERGLEVVRYVSAKSMLVLTLCLSFCMHLLPGTRFLVSA